MCILFCEGDREYEVNKFTELIVNDSRADIIRKDEDMPALRYCVEAMSYLSTEYSIRYAIANGFISS